MDAPGVDTSQSNSPDRLLSSARIDAVVEALAGVFGEVGAPPLPRANRAKQTTSPVAPRSKVTKPCVCARHAPRAASRRCTASTTSFPSEAIRVAATPWDLLGKGYVRRSSCRAGDEAEGRRGQPRVRNPRVTGSGENLKPAVGIAGEDRDMRVRAVGIVRHERTQSTRVGGEGLRLRSVEFARQDHIDTQHDAFAKRFDPGKCGMNGLVAPGQIDDRRGHADRANVDREQRNDGAAQPAFKTAALRADRAFEPSRRVLETSPRKQARTPRRHASFATPRNPE